MKVTPRDIAVLRLDNIGDAVLTTGFLEALRRAWPHSRIEVWCTEACAPLFARCPSVNTVTALPIIKPRELSPAEARERLQKFRQLVTGRFDLVINPRCAPDAYGAAAYASASEAPVRLAFRQREFVNGLDPNGAYTCAVAPPAVREHAAFVARHLLAALDVTETIPPPRIVVGRAASERAVAFMGGAPHVLFGIGASLPYKIWPPECFAAVAGVLMRKGFKVLLVGSRGESPLAGAIKARAADVVDLTGQTNFEDAAALAEASKVFVGNDSAPKHIAAAMDIPVVEIGWLGDGTPNFDYDRDFKALCSRYIRLEPAARFTPEQTFSGIPVRSITPEQVLAAIDAVLG